ncbi:hypothetical protein HDU91_005941 [Kappamyces sp. JEL0680]|nr:hypothetical protein HDU91_005941 [Kappamyces sp. JEL0680]
MESLRPSPATTGPSQPAQKASAADDLDPYDARILASGCAKEHEALQDCHWNHKDFRKCVEEMQKFKECWRRLHG